jgi:hypothetical protein
VQVGELLMPLKVKFGQPCWCKVSLDVTPLALQQQQQQGVVGVSGDDGLAAAVASAAGMSLAPRT